MCKGLYFFLRRDGDVLIAEAEVPFAEVPFVNGPSLFLWGKASPMYDHEGNVIGAIESMRDITERKRSEEKLAHMAMHDALTGLPNRSLFTDRLSLEIARARRSGDTLAVMLMDLDLFKEINDTLGHSVGDQLLQAVGKRVSGLLRKSDTLARMGGDEFLVLLPGIKQTEDLAMVTQKIHDAFREPYLLETGELHITTSIGVAVYPHDGEDVDMLIKNADIAMYKAKRNKGGHK